ncbi:MAG: hypothetical protein J6Q55_03830, partial [Clostridia bacterium]|nr:hypothetical protein [Clostridia bacterium]
TWELGRNDAVQSITGTRNAFVDYPEYAFLLFGKAVPSNYPTPSQSNGVTPPTPEDCTHSFGAATCTEPQTCTKCWATQGAALGHTTPDANGKCTRCGEILEIKTTHAGTQADPYSIADAYKVAETLTSGASSEKVYVKGQVVSAGEVVSNKYRKSLTIKDSSTNEILSINTANPKNSSDLNLKAGDTILLEGYIRINNSTQKAEMGTGSGGNYTYYSIVPAGQGGGTTHTHSFSQATCTTPATCSCGQTQGAALGHTTTSGTCTRCGVTIGGGQGSVTPDATVESFKQAVTNIQSATTLEQKFAAIKIAVNIYNTMDATQKAQVTTEIETLKTNINNYNVDTTSQNTNSNNALIFIGVSLAEALALALLLLKKVF